MRAPGCWSAPITSQELAANCSLVIRLPDGNLTGQFVAIAGPAPREIALTGGIGRFRTAVAAHACTALRGHARPPVEVCSAGGKSALEAASSRTPPTGNA